eukprot:3879769-Amphidinium_carterae.1
MSWHYGVRSTTRKVLSFGSWYAGSHRSGTTLPKTHLHVGVSQQASLLRVQKFSKVADGGRSLLQLGQHCSLAILN